MAVARPKKQQRLLLALAAVAALVIAGIIAMFALRDTAAYFRAPADLTSDRPAPGETFRLGGLVKSGSLHRAADGVTMDFVVTDMKADTPVSYRGLVPDLFREGQGVVTEGAFDAATHSFVADSVLAKHDENYMPPEAQHAVDEAQKTIKTLQ